MKKCSQCGYANDDGRTRCANCNAPLSEFAPEVDDGITCPSCGKKLKKGLKFCTSCGYKLERQESGASNASAPNPKPQKTSAEKKSKTVFAIASGALSLLTVMFSLIFLLTPFAEITVSALGSTESASASGISVFTSLISGNSDLTAMGVDGVLGYVASALYWIFAFIFVGYFTFAVSTIGSTGYAVFKRGIKFLSAMTVFALAVLIVGNIAASQALEGADGEIELIEAMGGSVSRYVGGTGLFITMLLMLGGYITLFALRKYGSETQPFVAAQKARKPVKIISFLALSALLAVTVIVGIVGLVGSSGESLVKKYINAINDKDIETVAKCLYPEGSDEYNQLVAMGSMGLPISGTVSDWSYNKIESNDYAERGNLRITVSGETESGVFYQQKSSVDNKWHITQKYKPAYYDGKVGTSYANAVPISGQSSGYRYYLYECAKSGTYTVSASSSVAVSNFSLAAISGTRGSNNGVYSFTCTMSEGKAYYIQLADTGDCIIEQKASIPSTSEIKGSLSAGETDYETMQAGKNLYSLRLSNAFYIVFAAPYSSGTNDAAGVTLTLYDSRFNVVDGLKDKAVIFINNTASKDYYLEINCERSVELSFGSQSLYFAGDVSVEETKRVNSSNSNRFVVSPTPETDGEYGVALRDSYGDDVSATYIVVDTDMNAVVETNGKYTLIAEKKYYVAVFPQSSYSSYSITVYNASAGNSSSQAITIVPGVPLTVNITKPGETKWYKFKPSRSYSCTVSTSGNADTFGVLYDNRYSALNKVGSDDDGGNSENFSVTYSVNSSYTYYIAVRINGNATGNFTLNVSRDEDGTSYDYAYTVAIDGSKNVGYNNGNVTYYRFVANASGTYRIYTTGNSTVKVTVQDFEGNTLTSKTGVSPANADLNVNVTAGKEYFVLVQIVNGSSSSASVLHVAD